MRILVTGGYGLIGAAVLARLHQDGFQVIGAGRGIEAARRRYPFAAWVEADFDRLLTPEAWRPLLHGVDAVVNCVGAFQTGARDDLQRVHEDAPHALFDACERWGPRRVVHVSAIGASPDAGSEFSRGKGVAEQDLAGRALDWLILRPGLVLAPAVYGGTALLRGLAGVPGVMPIVGADRRVQVVAIEDVATTVSWAMRDGVGLREGFDLVHPQRLPLGEIVRGYRRWLGFPERRVWPVPHGLGRLAAAAADLLGWLGWRSPARSTALEQLAADIVGNPESWIAATGIRPQSFAEILAARSATVQDRWFARLYLLKPVALMALAAFWIATGVISLGPGWEQGMALLRNAGWADPPAQTAIVAGALLDILLGGALMVQRFARRALQAMLWVSAAYLVAGTAVAPTLWWDPLGAFTKIAFVMVAALFALATLDER
jgi:uncharacterized protein YbjT (DUF2867 family)